MGFFEDLGKLFSFLNKRRKNNADKPHKVRRWFWGQMKR